MILEIIKEWFKSITYVVQSNLRNYANVLQAFLPYGMYLIGQWVCQERGKVRFGSELLIPLVVCVIICFIRSYANKIGKGTTIPLPKKRFTEVDDNEEVSIENDRVQELILYLADLEDYLERKGLLK